VWDSWPADDGERFHLFFLRASRALIDPGRRHMRASIGHATSLDLRSWELQPDALVPADAPAWDDQATWTGSVTRGPDGRWSLFYTGLSRAEGGLVQRVGRAVSDDLVTWTRAGAPLGADRRWYETLAAGAWTDEAWRDPWVLADPGGNGWHMLLTARAPSGPAGGRGVIGHAWSADLASWEARPPLTEPAGFGHMEVPQAVEVRGRPLLVFSCWPDRMERGGRGGVWVAPGETLLGPWDLEAAAPIAHPSLYAARLVRDRSGDWFALGFRDTEDGAFVGEIADPVPFGG
jgi:beta-fructofuranosidase